jgi:hypothetical protein
MRIRQAVRDDFGLNCLPSTQTTDVPVSDRIVVMGAQGIGKTAAFVGRDGTPGALHSGFDCVTSFYLPSSAKAEEAYQDYLSNAPFYAPHAVFVRGRSAVDPGQPSKTMCYVANAATKAARMGANVRRDFCMSCPFADLCGYLQQEDDLVAKADDPRGLVIFTAHAFLY